LGDVGAAGSRDGAERGPEARIVAELGGGGDEKLGDLRLTGLAL